MFAGNPNFTVLPSSRILVNDPVDLKCEFNNTQPGVFFKFPQSLVCAIQFSNNTCLNCKDWKTSCPDKKVYVVKAYAQITWNAKTLSCASVLSQQIEGISEIFDVKGIQLNINFTKRCSAPVRDITLYTLMGFVCGTDVFFL